MQSITEMFTDRICAYGFAILDPKLAGNAGRGSSRFTKIISQIDASQLAERFAVTERLFCAHYYRYFYTSSIITVEVQHA